MKPTINIVPAQGNIVRLTVAPDRVLLKVPADISDRYYKHAFDFAEYVVEQFTDINDTWRGSVDFEIAGVLHMTTKLRTGNGMVRKYEAVV